MADMKKYNMHIHSSELSLAQSQLMVFLTKSGFKITVHFTQNPRYGRFGTKDTYILQKRPFDKYFQQFLSANTN